MEDCYKTYQQVLPDIFFDFQTTYLYITDYKNSRKSRQIFDNFSKIAQVTASKQLSVDSYLIIVTYIQGQIKYYRFSSKVLTLILLKKTFFKERDRSKYQRLLNQDFYITGDLILMIKNGKIQKKILESRIQNISKQYQIQMLLRLRPEDVFKYPFNQIAPYNSFFNTIKEQFNRYTLNHLKIQVINDYLIVKYYHQVDFESQIYFIRLGNTKSYQITEQKVHKITFKQDQFFTQISHYHNYIFVLVHNRSHCSQVFQINGTNKLDRLVISTYNQFFRLSSNYLVWKDITEQVYKNHKLIDKNDLQKQ
ncbi:hypothetical protein pb186bvf_014871 [Paramecium bursaria]